MQRATGAAPWGNFDAFKRTVQATYQAGYKTITVVPLKVFEIAKTNLSKVHLRLRDAKTVLENTAFLTGFGAIFIALGALGVFLTQANAKGVPSKRIYLRIASYLAMIAGLVLVIYSAIMAETAAGGLNEVFKDLPVST
jgi:cytochrome c biogenesis protein CcdA